MDGYEEETLEILRRIATALETIAASVRKTCPRCGGYGDVEGSRGMRPCPRCNGKGEVRGDAQP